MTADSVHSRSSPITHSVTARSKATKQSSFVVHKLNCFAALAMTAGSAHSRSSPYNVLRHCLRQTRSVCAGSKATKQSSFVVHMLDCFAALAVTAGSAHSRSSRITRSSLPATNAKRLRWEQGDEAIQLCGSHAGLLRCALNDG